MSGSHDAFASFRLPVWDTLTRALAFLWATRRDLVLIAALPVVFMAIYSAALEIFIFPKDADGLSSGFPLWALAAVFLPQMILHAMFAAALNRAYLVPNETATVWSALRWDTRKTRFLARSVLIAFATTAVSLVVLVLLAIFTMIGAIGIPSPDTPPAILRGTHLPQFLAIAISLPLAARLYLWLPPATVDSPLSLLEIWRLGSSNTLRLTALLVLSTIAAVFIGIFVPIAMVGALTTLLPSGATTLLVTNLVEFALSYLGLAVIVVVFAAAYDAFLRRLANDPLYRPGMPGQ